MLRLYRDIHLEFTPDNLTQPADGGTYRLKLRLFAVIGRRSGEDARFWEKELAAEAPHRGVAREELGAAVRGMLGPAVEELGKAMKRAEVVAVLAEGDTPPAAEGGTVDK